MFGFSFGAGPRVSGAPASPSVEPLAVSDFKAGSYSIGGAAKTFAEMWDVSLFTNATLTAVADVGLQFDNTGATSASATCVAGAELFAAIDPELGFTAVMDVSLTTLGDGAADVDLEQFLASGADQHKAILFPPDMKLSVPGAGPVAVSAALADGALHRVAISYSPAEVAGSLDGGAAANIASTAAYATVTKLGHYFWSWKEGRVVVEKITFLPLQAAAALPGLSA